MTSNKKCKGLISSKPKKHFSIIVAYFLTILICIGFLSNGYFYEKQILSVNIITSIFFILAVLIISSTKNHIKYDKQSFVLVVVFLVVNIIGLFVASNLRDAIGNVLIITNAILIYLLAKHSLSEKYNLDIFLKGIYWTTVFIAITSLLSFIFGINILNSYINGRIYSTIGYPNTAALLFIFAIFIGNYFERTIKQSTALYVLSNAILFLGFIGTKSRGVFLLFPLLIIINIFLYPKEYRLKILGDFALLVIPCVFFAPIIYYGNFENRELVNGIISIISLLFLIVLSYYLPRLIKRHNLKIVVLIVIVSFIIGAGIFFVLQEEIDFQNTFARFTQISLEDSGLQSRLIFMFDALKIVKDNLLLGVGGGGWNSEYRAYRSYLYSSSEVHNHYLQVLVENGVLGFIIYIVLWFILILNLVKSYRYKKMEIDILLLIISIGLLFHSFIDFDFSYPVIYYLFWILIALSIKDIENLNKVLSKGTMVVGVLIAIIVITINISLLAGLSYGKSGNKLLAQNNIPLAMLNFERSIKFDPFNSTFLANISQIYFSKGITNNESIYTDKALDMINKSIQYNSTNFEWYIVKTKYLVELGQYNFAYQTAQKAINCTPLEEIVYYDTAKFFVEKGDNDAIPYAKKIITLAYEKGNIFKNSKYHGIFGINTNLNDSSKLEFLEGIIYLNDKQFALAKNRFLKSIDDKELVKEAKRFLQQSYLLSGDYLVNGRFDSGNLDGWYTNGNVSIAEKSEQKDYNWWVYMFKESNETSTPTALYQYVYDFEPRQKYIISFDAFSSHDNSRIEIFVNQLKKNEKTSDDVKMTSISLDNKKSKYNWMFETDDLLDRESLRIVFVVPVAARNQDVYISNIKMIKVE